MQKWFGNGASKQPRKRKANSRLQKAAAVVPERVAAVMNAEFAGQERPFEQPWTSLWLGQRGLQVSEAVHGVTFPACNQTEPFNSRPNSAAHQKAVEDFGTQWAHFLCTCFLPHFESRVDKIVFSGAIVEQNWPVLEKCICPDGVLRSASGRVIRVEQAVASAALLGAAKYALSSGYLATDLWGPKDN